MKNLPNIDLRISKELETATFAMGWFWGPDAQFGLIDGVVRTRVGYAGGTKENPIYYDLGNHSETIQIDYDSRIISYEELLNVFFRSHTPQYKSPSRQYMSIVFYHSEKQKRSAYERRKKEEEEKKLKIYTEIIPFTKFYLAENYHQKYYLQLTKELMKEFSYVYKSFREFINSTSAAHVNGYIKGYGTIERLSREKDDLGLSEDGINRLLDIVKGYGR